MQNVKNTEKVSLIRYCPNIIHTSDYSDVSCSWRKCCSVLLQSQEEKAACYVNRSPDSCLHNSCFMLLCGRSELGKFLPCFSLHSVQALGHCCAFWPVTKREIQFPFLHFFFPQSKHVNTALCWPGNGTASFLKTGTKTLRLWYSSDGSE